MGIPEQIDTLRERVENSPDIADADRDVLNRLDNRLSLLQQEYSDYRHKKLLRHGVIMAEEVGGLAGAIEDRDAAEKIVSWINREYDNEESNRDYRSALRVIGKHVTDGDGVPEPLDWIPTGTSSDYDPTPDPREMLHWEEHVIPMIEHTQNSRDAAMIALQFDAGLRGGEFKALAYGDVQDHKHGLQVTVEGKQGRRTVMLIPSVPHVNRWLDDHPGGSPADPMWCRLNSPDEVSDTTIYKAFNAAADRAGVERPVTLTNFRKSSAAFLASRNLNQAHIEDHHGWVRGSKAAARYISVFSDDADRELARLHGKDVSEEEAEEIGPLTCSRCGRDTPRHKDFCVHCHAATDHQAAAEIQEQQAAIFRILTQIMREYPDAFDKLEDADQLVQFIDRNPDALSEVRAFVEEHTD